MRGKRTVLAVGSVLAFPLLAAAEGTPSWTGPYIGAFGGAAWSKASVGTELDGLWDDPSDPSHIPDEMSLRPILNRGLDGAGAIGGIVIGHSWQFGNLVFGAEADFSGLGADESRVEYNVSVVPVPQPYRAETSSSIDWLATLRARLGFASGRSLVYVTGGVAVGEMDVQQDLIQLNQLTVSYTQSASLGKTSIGWALGGGFEYVLSESWSVKLQYLHVDLGSHGTKSAGNCFFIPEFCARYTGTHKVDIMLDTVTAGLNYRF